MVRGVLIACAIVASGCTSSSVTSSTATEPSVVKCQVSLAMSTAAIGADGGSGALSVSTQPECAWEAVSGASWISNLTPASGQGTGQVQFVVTANPDPVARQADIRVNGQSAGVRQDSAPCRFGISASSQSVDAGGGTFTVSVTGANSCSWTATSNVSWVTIVSGASGTGSGTVRLQVSANTGDVRTSALAIAGQTFTVAQGAVSVNPACTYSLSAPSHPISASGGPGAVAVTTAPGCAWTAVSNDPWITVTSGASSVGDNTVGFSVAANSGAAPRTGTLTVANQAFIVTQASSGPPCEYTINPTSRAFDAAGGTGETAVSTTSNCNWTASGAPWITISSGASGTGNGTVVFHS